MIQHICRRLTLITIMDATSLVLQQFRSCWDGFRSWKAAHNSQAMLSLTRHPASEDSLPQIDEAEQAQESQLTGPTFTVTEYDSDSDPCDSYKIGVESFDVEPTKPHPEYTQCVPTTRNIMIGDDSDYMPFIPYSDDASFNHELHTQHYGYFAWQHSDDPDCMSPRKITHLTPNPHPVEVVCIQTIKQLMSEHGLTVQQIADTNVMPTSIIHNITSYLGGRRRYFSEVPGCTDSNLTVLGITLNGHLKILSTL